MVMDTSRLTHPKKTYPKYTKAESGALKMAKDFRGAVWLRDGGVDRATGQPLEHESGAYDTCGQVCHLRGRGAYPELKYEPSNAVLMSSRNHIHSDARGGRLLRLTDPETGEPAVDGSKPIRFSMYDKAGTLLWTRISGPVNG